MQAAGGVSRIFQQALPAIMASPSVGTVVMYLPEPEPLRQCVSGISHTIAGCWLREDRRPFNVRHLINRKLLMHLNDWLFNHSCAAVYLPTYYSLPPKGIPSVCFVYDMTYERHPESFPASDVVSTCTRKKNAILASARCLCISQQTKRDLIDVYGIRDDQCDLVYLGGGERKASPESLAGRFSSPLKVLYVGNWETAYKNFEFMLSGLQAFKKRHGPSIELHVVSRRRSSAADRQRHAALFDGGVVYHESAGDDELHNLYRECDIFAYPSLWEGFGIPIAEAMSWGCAVICSHIPAFHEVGGNAVEYFDPRDVDSFCVAINQAMGSGRSLDAVKARTDRAALFTWEKCAYSMLESILKVVP